MAKFNGIQEYKRRWTLMSILDIFKSSKAQDIAPLDLSWMVSDMHSHLIPDIDDGSKSIQESVQLVKRLEGYGLKKLIITPHIMTEFFRNTPEIIQAGLDELKTAVLNEPTLKSAEINVETFKGVVQLSGFVNSQADINKAAEVARGVKGVVSVKNDTHLKAKQ